MSKTGLPYGIVGTVNLDYRSLVHHFENGVWLYKQEIKEDMATTMKQSIEMNKGNIKDNILQRLIRSLVRIFSPML